MGSDARGGVIQDDTEGARADSVMLLHKAVNGQTSLTSLPRDTFVDIPEYGENKINAAYSYGGPKLLVQTVEKLSGLTVDHYVEVGMTGVSQTVDAVGGVNVCLDYDVADEDSGLVWDTSQGTCQTVDGTKALAYSRMRKSDPTGDVGRGQRQRAVISAVVSKAATPSTAFSFSRQDALVDAGTNALTVDRSAGTMSIAQMVLAFRSASGGGLTGAPPIEDPAYSPRGRRHRRNGAAAGHDRTGLLLQAARREADGRGLQPVLTLRHRRRTRAGRPRERGTGPHAVVLGPLSRSGGGWGRPARRCRRSRRCHPGRARPSIPGPRRCGWRCR